MGTIHTAAGIVLFSVLSADIILGAPEERIVGGQPANPGQFPYQILLKYRGGFRCGGSIISRNYILTAAHCVFSGDNKGPASDFRVVAGSINANEERVARSVSQVIVYPEYKNGVVGNDVALLKLSNPLGFDSNVNSVKLYSGSVPGGSKITISGFGYTDDKGPVSSVLKWNTATALSDTECRQRTGNHNGNRLCVAKSRGNGVCYGDSGGPAVYNGQLVGVANNVIQACGTDYPDLFANVPFFMDWIKKNSDV